MRQVIQGIHAQQGRTCMLNSIRLAVRYLRPGAEVSEALLLGLGAGLRFRYGLYEHDGEPPSAEAARPAAGGTGMVDIACFHIQLDWDTMIDTLGCLGVGFAQQEHATCERMVQAIKDDLRQDLPVQVPVNNRHLPYLPDELRRDASRFVLCNGWDDDERQVWVIDSFIPTTPPSLYQGPLAREAFVAALDLRAVVDDDVFPSWHYSRRGARRDFSGEQVRASFARSRQAMAAGERQVYRFARSRVVYRCGAAGYQDLLGDLNAVADTELSPAAAAWLEELHSLIVSYGGPVTARSLYGEFLGWISQSGIAPVDPALAGRCEEISQQWATVANVLFKGAATCDVACLRRVVQRLERIVQQEQALLSDLCGLSG